MSLTFNVEKTKQNDSSLQQIANNLDPKFLVSEKAVACKFTF